MNKMKTKTKTPNKMLQVGAPRAEGGLGPMTAVSGAFRILAVLPARTTIERTSILRRKRRRTWIRSDRISKTARPRARDRSISQASEQ